MQAQQAPFYKDFNKMAEDIYQECRKEHPDAAKIRALIAEGANLEHTRKKMSGLIHAESQRKTPDIGKVKLLIELGGNPDYCNNWNGKSTLYHAVKRQSVELVRLLVSHNANPRSGHISPILQAYEKVTAKQPTPASLEILKIVMEKADLSSHEVADWAAAAIQDKKADALQYLIGMKPEILNWVTSGTDKNYLLHCAEGFPKMNKEPKGDPVIIGIVRDAIARNEARPKALPAPPKTPAPAIDPRDARIAKLEELIRELSGELTSIRNELDDIKNPKSADLCKPAPGTLKL